MLRVSENHLQSLILSIITFSVYIFLFEMNHHDLLYPGYSKSCSLSSRLMRLYKLNIYFDNIANK